MTATLRVVLDQLFTIVDPDEAGASIELTRGLVEGAPPGCVVAALTPAASRTERDDSVPGLAEVRRLALGRRELATAWQLGSGTGAGGMIHSASLMAPLVRHDRVHDHDQTVVTVWDTRAWDAPGTLPRGTSAWRRAMLKRAARHADAVVVPTHSLAARVAELAPLGERLRVIPGAAPEGFVLPTDAAGRLREQMLPSRFVVVAATGRAGWAMGLGAAAAAAREDAELSIVVIDVPEGGEPMVADVASGMGLPERRVHVRGALTARDRAAVVGSAVAVVASDAWAAFPWRVVEALALGTPVVAVDSPVHREVLLDGGVLAGDADALAEELRRILLDEASARRLRVLAEDRSRSFSWRESAERVWQLHAEL